MLPSRFSVLNATVLYSTSSTGPSTMPVTSPRRRSIAPAVLGMKAIAAAVTSSEAKANARSGRRSATLHLDPDDLANPEEPDRLHDQARDEHPLAHRIVEEQLHVLGVQEVQNEP